MTSIRVKTFWRWASFDSSIDCYILIDGRSHRVTLATKSYKRQVELREKLLGFSSIEPAIKEILKNNTIFQDFIDNCEKYISGIERRKRVKIETVNIRSNKNRDLKVAAEVGVKYRSKSGIVYQISALNSEGLFRAFGSYDPSQTKSYTNPWKPPQEVSLMRDRTIEALKFYPQWQDNPTDLYETIGALRPILKEILILEQAFVALQDQAKLIKYKN